MCDSTFIVSAYLVKKFGENKQKILTNAIKSLHTVLSTPMLENRIHYATRACQDGKNQSYQTKSFHLNNSKKPHPPILFQNPFCL